MTLARFSAPSDGVPDQAMIEAYQRDGFLVLDGFADAAARTALTARIETLVSGFDPVEVRTVFSTRAQSHAADAYFRQSGDTIRFFLEEGAFDEDGRQTAPKDRILNKIGHAMHDLDPVFSAFSRSGHLARLAEGLGLEEPGLMQSMVIFKQPRIGGEVGMHQDATFLYTDPVSVTGFWFALEDADETNGCLFAIPGAHRRGLAERFRYDTGDKLVMQPVDAVAFDPADAVPLPVEAGALVVLHGLLPHFSGPNLSDRSRLAYTLHVIDKRADWAPDNWLRRGPDMPVRGFA